MKQLLRSSTASFGVIIAVFLCILLFGILAIATRANAQTDERTTGSFLTIHDRGIEQATITTAKTIGEALKDAGIELTDQDIVEPGVDQEIVAEQYSVNIYRARPVTVIDGGIKRSVFSPYQTAQQIAESVDIKLYPEDEATLGRSENIVSDGVGLELVIHRATPINFTLYGKKTVIRTQAKTVGEMLTEKQITLQGNDKLSVSASTPITAGMSLSLWREGKQTITVEEDVDFPISQIQDANRSRGYKKIQTPGVKGAQTVTYEIIIRNGKEVSRKKIAGVVTEQPKKQVEIIGVKSNYSSSLEEWLLALRTCEAGGRYNTNTGNGFYGAYQFMISTWDRVAAMSGRSDLVGVRPDLASPADQDYMVITNTKLSSGGLATQHPGCYNKLGLSAFPPA